MKGSQMDDTTSKTAHHAIALPAAHHNTHELPSFQTLQEGVYWAAREEIDLGEDYFENEQGSNSRQKVILPAKSVYLLIKLHFVDDQIHAVTLHHHPLDRRAKNHKFLVADFLDKFEPSYDAEAIRAKELAAVQQEVTDLQEEMAKGPSEQVIISGLLESKELDVEAGLPDQDINEDSPMGAIVTQASSRAMQVEMVQRQIRNQQAIVQARAKWMSATADKLAKTVRKMTPFFTEKSAAALASCQEALSKHDRILKAVTSLDLYTLKGVEIQPLCAGDSADPSEQIYVFQRKLFLDEETLIHHAYGGADYNSYSEFARELSESETLRDRLIPCKRGVVAVQWRRTPKKYDTENPLINAMMNQPNFVGFLLVRDGDNFYQVYSDILTANVHRLFPTFAEMESYFKTRRGEDITFRDIDFADARESHDNAALYYKRMLLLLWGLQDNKKLFGTLDMEEQHGQLNWFTHEVQTKLLRLVYDDERQTLLGELMPPVHKWIEEMNSYMQPGSRVFSVHKMVMNSESCPGAVHTRRWGGKSHTEFIAEPDQNQKVGIAYRKGADYYVDIPCNSTVYDRKARKSHTRRFNAACNITRENYLPKERFAGYLCLDAVDPDHIDYYLNSREDRQYYLYYVKLFFGLKEMLANERKREHEFVEECRQALLEGQVISPEYKILPLIRNAIRNYRALNKGEEIPQKDDPRYQACFETVLNILYVLVGAGRDRVAEVEQLLQAEGRYPLRFVITGAGKLIVYATLLGSEMEDRLGSCPWVMALTLEEKKTKIAVISRVATLLPKFSPTEMTIKEWHAAPDYAGLENPSGTDYYATKKLFASLAQAPAQADKWFRTLDDDTFDELLDNVVESIEDASKGNVVRTNVVIPLMVLRFQSRCYNDGMGTTYNCYTQRYSLLYWEADALKMLYSFATKAQQKRIELALGSIYQRPSTHVTDIRQSLGKLETFGRLHAATVQQLLANANFGSLRPSNLPGFTNHLMAPFDFSSPGDRITLYENILFRGTTIKTYEVVEAAAICREANSVLNEAGKYRPESVKDANKKLPMNQISIPFLPGADTSVGAEDDD